MHLFKSPHQTGWRADYELDCARRALASIGAEPRVVTDLKGLGPGVLVLSNVRRMSRDEIQAARDFCARGGKLLATAQTSYRQPDDSPWQQNGLALGPELGGEFRRWAQPDRLESVLLEEAPILLGKRNAMLLKPSKGATVLGKFETGDAAILETAHGIYCGEDLLAPEDLAAPETRALLSRLMQKLLEGYRPSEGLYEDRSPDIPFREMLPEGRPMRILIEEGLSELTVGKRQVRIIQTVGKLPAVAVYDAAGKLLERSESPLRLRDEPYCRLRITRPNGAYRSGAFRGKLEVAPTDEGLTVVNELSLEEYLAGVVPNEVPPTFPLESLKAMAVVARSFSLAHRGEKHSGADLCDEVHCQVYGGVAGEADETTAAVLGSSGVLLTYGGEPIDAVFFAVCGGVGQDADRVWGGRGSPYLVGSPDTLETDPGDLSSEEAITQFLEHPPLDACCARAGRFRWKESYTTAELESKLAQSVPLFRGPLRELEVTVRGPLGRAEELVVNGRYVVRGDAIRWITSGGKIGSAGLNSTLFVIRRSEKGFELLGGGWGHGAGMCQEGAAGRARAGAEYRAILEHYYPGTEVSGGR